MIQASMSLASVDKAPVDRQMLIDGQLVETHWSFPTPNPDREEALGHGLELTIVGVGAAPAVGNAGLAEFLEGKSSVGVVPLATA